MAKAAKSKISQAADAARKKFAAAKEANAKTDNASTQKALEAAKAEMQSAVAAECRERFTTVGNARVLKARAAIRRVINVANKKSYNYTPEEGARVLLGLKEAVKEVENAFNASGEKGSAGDSFSVVGG